MKKAIFLPSLLLLLLNCYLADLEEYKHLERHDDDRIDLVNTDRNYQYHQDSIHNIAFEFNFHIERVVYYDIFKTEDISKKLSSVYIADNGIRFKKGKHYYNNQLIYDHETTEGYFTIKVTAISEVDTLYKNFSFYINGFYDFLY